MTDAVLQQAGVVTVDRSDELLSVANSVASLPTPQGSNVGILADGGGHATLAADALANRHLNVPTLTDETQNALGDVLPSAASIVNPVDVAGGTDEDQSVFVNCADAILSDPNVDTLLLSGLFGGYGIRFAEQYTAVEIEAAERLATLAAGAGKPLVVQSAYEGLDTEPHAVLREQGIPVVESLDIATASIDALAGYGEHQSARGDRTDFHLEQNENASDRITAAIREGRTQLSEVESKRVLADAALPVTSFDVVDSPDAARDAVAALDAPAAMKVVSRDIVHKSDAGGVALEVTTKDAGATYETLVESARDYAPDATIDGVLVSPMRDAPVELIVGVVDDDQFGPTLMCGIGGIFVEVLEDVAFRALPTTRTEARELLADIDAQELFDGARGNDAVDRDAVVALLCQVSQLVEANPGISELDLNPVFAGPDGVEIVDAAITLDLPTTETGIDEAVYGGESHD